LNEPKSDIKVEKESLKFKQIIFGRYCGECDENCAPMFRLILDKVTPTLSADFEDTFFSLQNNREFKTDLKQEKNLNIAIEIVDKIPDTLYNWKADKNTFGCPDCTDGCGYYLEMKKNNGNIKIFNLDDLPKSDEIPSDVLEFTHLLSERIKILTE
jgi:hypothetical protein